MEEQKNTENPPLPSQVVSELIINTDFIRNTTNPYDISYTEGEDKEVTEIELISDQNKEKYNDLFQEISISSDFKLEPIPKKSKHNQIYFETIFSLLVSVNILAKFESTRTQSTNIQELFQQSINAEMLNNTFPLKAI